MVRGTAGRGVVLGNRMGNMMLTNHKLYLRAVGIVGEVARVPARGAVAAVLRAVYGWEGAGEAEAALEEEARDPGAALKHVAAAAVVEHVIPTALLLAVAAREGVALGAARARGALQKEPRVRLAAAALGLSV